MFDNAFLANIVFVFQPEKKMKDAKKFVYIYCKFLGVFHYSVTIEGSSWQTDSNTDVSDWRKHPCRKQAHMNIFP